MILEDLNVDFRDLFNSFRRRGDRICGRRCVRAVFSWGTSGQRRIDILTQISGVTFDEAWASRASGEVEGRTIGFIGRDALLKNKEATGRPKDLAEAARLRRNG